MEAVIKIVCHVFINGAMNLHGGTDHGRLQPLDGICFASRYQHNANAPHCPSCCLMVCLCDIELFDTT